MEQDKWQKIASEAAIDEVVASFRDRNIESTVVNDRKEALAKIRELIPDGKSVMTGGSTTLSEIGFTELLKSGDHPWNNLKDGIAAEKDEKRQNELRAMSVLADYFLGSVHAVSKRGEVVIASATGSQLPAYSFTSSNVIWVVGAQKIVADLDEAIRRVREYAYFLEDERMKKEGQQGTMMGKLLIFEKEFTPGRVRMIIVKEKLGF